MTYENDFKNISCEELENALKLVGKDWMLITVADKENHRVNAMTASWGAMGVLWNKNVCICFVRPQRHTAKLLAEQESFSIAFMGEQYRGVHAVLGRESGRDVDKLAKCSLDTEEMQGIPVIKQADTLLLCKKLYESDLAPEGFLDPSLLSNYTAGDYHRCYICEIVSAYTKKSDND